MIKAEDSKITVVSLNPSIDWTYKVPEFNFGEINRVDFTRQDVSGKGINVCIALKNLGLEPLVTGFNFFENGRLLTNRLNSLGIKHDFIEVSGSIRVNIKLYDEASKEMTELNQKGSLISEEAQNALKNKLSKRSGILVLSGSLPPGVPANFYAELYKNWDGKVFLDASGNALKSALETKQPFLIKPNLYELSSLLNINSNLTHKDIKRLCQNNFISKGTKYICVSLGAKGAILVSQHNSFYSPAFNVKARGLQGAGDSMIAGFIYGILKNAGEKELLHFAVSASAASVINEGSKMCSYKDFKEFLLQGNNILEI